MHWIKEVEIAKSSDDLMTSQSITGRTDFPDCDVLDAMIASALNRLLDKHVRFRKSVSVEEQRAQKFDVPIRCFSVGGDPEQDVRRLPWEVVSPCR